MEVFSTRGNPRPDSYEYEFHPNVRSRIMFTASHIVSEQIDIPTVMAELHGLLLRRFGRICRSEYGTSSGSPALDHVSECSDKEFLDTLEILFRTESFFGGQRSVDAINEIFDEENIGYELTSFVVLPDPSLPKGARVLHRLGGPRPHVDAYPKVIMKSEKIIHAEAVEPTMQLLADPRFATANIEFIDGLVHLRKGEFDDAITSCGASVETVLKTICTIKGWHYDKDKAGHSDLLAICGANGLFPSFYQNVLAGTGSIRNKVGSAHGKGPSPSFAATKELADHMVHTCCSNILLLVSLAKL